ncbi:hypothetical protein MSAN_01750500 [Mycena sanguinolenta]|uniref:Uncharacterized protein n=1 Tax=Mycena sanguinolenta TaxID=230812 RepID=A0A8H6XWF5_9AGAR|nr:hypothetical protein MSAN_01750500 [Mycena sanguinolenta]
MWMQGANGDYLNISYENFEPTADWAPTTSNDCAPSFSFNGSPYFASNITPDTASFNGALLFNPQDGLIIPSNTVFPEQLPFNNGFDLDLGADTTLKVQDARDDWEKFCGSVTSINVCWRAHLTRRALGPGAQMTLKTVSLPLI